MFFNLELLLWISPALLLGAWAQFKVKSTYAVARQVPARLTGAAAARHILNEAGLGDVAIEQVPGELSDHYDPRAKVLRLSRDVYGTNSAAAVGIAAHEAGHALQDAKHYAPLVVRNFAVPAANFGSSFGMLLIFAGFALASTALGPVLFLAGVVGFGCVAAFQLVNLPVEFDASNRAKRLLVDHGIVGPDEMVHVRRVLNAAAWTYVAATLQSVLILLYYASMFAGRDE